MPTELQRYRVIGVDLATARHNKRFDIKGDFVLVKDITEDANLSIKFDEKGYDSIDLQAIRIINTPFDRFFLTNTAQSGASATLYLGGAASFTVDPLSIHKAHIRRDSLIATVFDAQSLAAGGLMTHAGLNIEGYQTVSFSIYSTGNSTIYIQFSPDNTNWYDLKGLDDSNRSWNCNDEKITVMADAVAKYVRILVYATTASTITGVIQARI